MVALSSDQKFCLGSDLFVCERFICLRKTKRGAEKHTLFRVCHPWKQLTCKSDILGKKLNCLMYMHNIVSFNENMPDRGRQKGQRPL